MVSRGTLDSVTEASTLTWDNFALLKGLHQTVHLLLCQQQIEIVLQQRREGEMDREREKERETSI